MLSEHEKRGVCELLERMENRDLVSLVQTVTNRLILPESVGDAIQAIILHTDRALDLLKRRKMRKDFLFKYLHDKKVSVEASADKGEMVRRVLEVWGSRDEVEMLIEDENSLDGPPPAPVPSRNASHTSLCSLDFVPTAFGLNRSSLQPELGGGLLRRCESNASIMNCDESSNSSFTFGSTSAHPPPPPSPALSEPSTASSLPFIPLQTGSAHHTATSSAFTQSQCQEMANNFVKWFYDLMNTGAPGRLPSPEFNATMFWADASAKVNLLGGNGETMESLQVEGNGAEVCDMLKDVVRRHGLHFNPNLCDEGVRGRLDPHGLVLVLSCGTLHNQHTVCGIFEQAFGLVRDPGCENNWKIKQTEARLLAKTVEEKPCLANSSLCAIAYS